ncbi:hypothetical protein [Mucilaginibacter sp. UR6-11]|uniref:hypothetical protein n=1 Tax=Mucilaginibacter sp. UR6-11 TaxID=1435644 RepID=UPI001E361D0D|nr:hypothetical protein [Mucilaginibacter sp. UR6-11]MCC8425776.1 hypothetical protein [Mucilaginibacter sp. UR6-11]
MLKTLFSFLPVLMATLIYAQTHTDTSAGHSPARTLTYQQYQAYLKGEAGEELARVAEMNHYPLPDKVLKWRNELDLSPIQIKKITEASAYLRRRRLQIGGSVIDTERMLDSMFRYNKVQDGGLIFYANRYGLYQGELRNALLQACLSTQKLLSQKQIDRYEGLQKRN